MSGPSAERTQFLVRRILRAIDPRCRDRVDLPAIPRWPAPRQRLVICGHRAAGKSRLLPVIAELTGRPAIDLDREIERRTGRELKAWVREDPESFRRAEREVFSSLDVRACVSVGGGFLSLHADLLEGSFPLLIPVSFESYCARLRDDRTRPRLRPELTIEEELRQVFEEREALHARVDTIPIASLLATAFPSRVRRVVTLPPGVQGRAATEFAQRARLAGAHLIEARTDLHGEADLPIEDVAHELPLLVSERGVKLPPRWLRAAKEFDREGPGGSIQSFHATSPMSFEAALTRWDRLAPGVHLKHVEPLGDPLDGARLFKLQAELQRRFGRERVTVLAMGPCASPFRAILAKANALDYVALASGWSAAPGQRRIEDARRADRGLGLRRGILGSHIEHSRSPRIHPAPFDRIDLPEDAPVGRLIDALHPHYGGFAVTSPFKKVLAQHIGSSLEAINTLVRSTRGWEGFNTDVDGAAATLERMGDKVVTVLGDGGATVAIREAAARANVRLRVLRRAELGDQPLSGTLLWTWPATVSLPASLAFEGARVAIIAYGAPGRRIAAEIHRRGGVPVALGACWFVAQARRQRELWENAR